MPAIFLFYDIVVTCFWAFLWHASVTAAWPLLSPRDADNQDNGHISSRVIKLMVIAALLFVSILLALYLYRKCTPRARVPVPMYNIPHTTLVPPTMGTRPIWRPARKPSTSSTTSASPLIRATFSSEQSIVLEQIVQPAKAHTKSKFTGPTAGMSPV